MCKTVLITGASRGIGRGIALSFAKEGWQVALNCRQNVEQLNETKALVWAVQNVLFFLPM